MMNLLHSSLRKLHYRKVMVLASEDYEDERCDHFSRNDHKNMDEICGFLPMETCFALSLLTLSKS
jgi:hypothetical protein